MYTVSTARFRKLRTCPSVEVLILYRDAELASERQDKITRHLTSCDFCGAEMQLLSRHWTKECPILKGAGEMPSSLRRLAEDVMAEPPLDRARFVEAVCDIDRLTLTDAV